MRNLIQRHCQSSLTNTGKKSLGIFLLILVLGGASLALVYGPNFASTRAQDPLGILTSNVKPEVPVSAPITPPKPLVWRFDRYEASPYELKWFEIVKNDTWGKSICSLQHSEAEKYDTYNLLNQTQVLNTGGKVFGDNVKFFSRMVYKSEGSSQYGIQLIEPLFGILRDPCDAFCNSAAGNPYSGPLKETSGQSKNHILPLSTAPWALVNDPTITDAIEWNYHPAIAPWYCSGGVTCSKTETVLFDLGASYFDRWDAGATNAAAGSYFKHFYHDHNFTLVDYFAYEYQALDNQKVFSLVPEDLMAAYHWINVGVTNDTQSKMNPWNTLKSLKSFRHTEVTTCKLDIDSPHIENSLVDQLIEAGGLGLQEFFYEHHVNIEVMNGVWGHARMFNSSEQTPNLLTSYDMFLAIRKLGTRSHSWP